MQLRDLEIFKGIKMQCSDCERRKYGGVFKHAKGCKKKGEKKEDGWFYYWGFKNKKPDMEPIGPFLNEEAAEDHAILHDDVRDFE